MTPIFCPKCRMRIMPPSFLLKSNIKVENGITINCGNKNCKGKVKIKQKKEVNG